MPTQEDREMALMLSQHLHEQIVLYLKAGNEPVN